MKLKASIAVAALSIGLSAATGANSASCACACPASRHHPAPRAASKTIIVEEYYPHADRSPQPVYDAGYATPAAYDRAPPEAYDDDDQAIGYGPDYGVWDSGFRRGGAVGGRRGDHTVVGGQVIVRGAGGRVR